MEEPARPRAASSKTLKVISYVDKLSGVALLRALSVAMDSCDSAFNWVQAVWLSGRVLTWGSPQVLARYLA